MTIKRISTSYSAPTGERNDCSVRALSVAARISYERAYGLYAKVGREPNKGTYTRITMALAERCGFTNVRLHPPHSPFKPTLAQFIRLYPKGSYLVHRSGHAFALVDGVVHDWEYGTGPRTRIHAAWEVSK